MGLRMKNFYVMWGSLKNLVFKGHEKPIHTAELAKKERLDSLLISGGLGKKEGGGVFEVGAHYEQAVFYKIT